MSSSKCAAAGSMVCLDEQTIITVEEVPHRKLETNIYLIAAPFLRQHARS